MKKLKLWMLAAILICVSGVFTSCSSKNDNEVKDEDKADLVVYGKIYTAEGDQVVEAFAVKDRNTRWRSCHRFRRHT